MRDGIVTNVVFAGLGGQGVLKASDILSEAAFIAGFDVKKSEIHGMSQRGGSVTSDVRYGPRVYSPMVPAGKSDFLVALDSMQVAPARHFLKEDGILIVPELLLKEEQNLDDLETDPPTPITKRGLNVALLGFLSVCLDLPESCWRAALRNNLPPKTHAVNDAVFDFGRAAGMARSPLRP